MHKQAHGKKSILIGESFLRNLRRAPSLAAITGLLLSLAVAPPTGQAAPADDYTREIMAEGGRLETLGQAQREREKLEKSMAKSRPAPSTARKAAAAPAPTPAPAAAPAPKESQAAFETKLREAFPASFALYSLLTPEEKNTVRAEYDQTDSPGAARFHPVVSKIISLSTKKR